MIIVAILDSLFVQNPGSASNQGRLQVVEFHPSWLTQFIHDVTEQNLEAFPVLVFSVERRDDSRKWLLDNDRLLGNYRGKGGSYWWRSGSTHPTHQTRGKVEVDGVES